MPRGRPVLLLRGSQRFYETPRRGEPYASRHNAVGYFCRREGKDASRPKTEPSGWGREPGPLGAGNPSLASLGQGRWQARQCLGVQRLSLACRTFQQRRPILGRVTSEAKRFFLLAARLLLVLFFSCVLCSVAGLLSYQATRHRSPKR